MNAHLSSKTIGTCSLCGGRVSVPQFYWSTVAPQPTCESCGAVKQSPFGPVIPMELPGPADARWIPQYVTTCLDAIGRNGAKVTFETAARSVH